MAAEPKNMTIAEAAKFLRGAAVATAQLSQNWDNFEAICKDLIEAAYKGGIVERRTEGDR